MNNIIPCVDFSVELFEDVALSKVSRLAKAPRSVPVMACVRVLSPFKAASCSVVRVGYILFTRSLVRGADFLLPPGRCAQCCRGHGVRMSPGDPVFSSFGLRPEAGLLGHAMVLSFGIVRSLPTVGHSSSTVPHSHRCARGLQPLHLPPTPVICFLPFAVSHPHGSAHLTFEKRTFISEPLDYKDWPQLVTF